VPIVQALCVYMCLLHKFYMVGIISLYKVLNTGKSFEWPYSPSAVLSTAKFVRVVIFGG